MRYFANKPNTSLMKKNLSYTILSIMFLFFIPIVAAQPNEKFEIVLPTGQTKLIGYTKEKTWVRFHTDSGEQTIKMKLGDIHNDTLYDYRPGHSAVALKNIMAIQKAGLAGRIAKSAFSGFFILSGGTLIFVGSIISLFTRDKELGQLALGGLVSVGIGIGIAKINIRKWHTMQPDENVVTKKRTLQSTLNQGFIISGLLHFL